VSYGAIRRLTGWRRVVRIVGFPLEMALVGAIRLYQIAISPLLGPKCKFYPSCSTYGVAALEVHGPVKGSALAVARVCRCHPWQLGGINPVPPPGRWRAEVDLHGDPRIPTRDLHDTTDLVGV